MSRTRSSLLISRGSLMNLKSLVATLVAAVAVSYSTISPAQTAAIVSEDFTGQASTNQWFFFQGACLTGGTATSTTPASPGYIPSCAQVFNSYYGLADSTTGKSADPYLNGGYAGFLGSTSAPTGTVGTPTTITITPDPQTQVTQNGVTTLQNNGALRLTNGNTSASSGGFFERGAIVSAFTFPTGQGLQISFETVTYLGNSGGTGPGSGSDGADGISFYLLDGCMPITGGAASGITGAAPPSGCAASTLYGSSTYSALGATGGSLAYSCSNNNKPFDGLAGGYLALGIDEYGNFLNGTTNTINELTVGGTTLNSASGDNTASGGGYQAGRIGLRGAGNIAWQTLNNAYGSTSSGPYYPTSLTSSCPYSLTYNSSTGMCGTCPSGTFTDTSTGNCDTCTSGYTWYNNLCNKCTNGASWSTTSNSCVSPAAVCASGGTWNSTLNYCSNACTTSAGSYNTSTSKCDICPSNTTFDLTHSPSGGATPCAKCTSGSYSTTTGKCGTNGTPSWKSPSGTPTNPTVTPTSTDAPVTPASTPGSSVPYSLLSVQKTCSTGHLWNYATPSAPVDEGTTTLTTDPTTPNSANTAGILDYNAIPGAYTVIPTTGTGSFKIAAEAAATRSQAPPILYNLKITQDGLLSLSYSYNGGSAVPVITAQNITTSNGALPSTFRFGFAGSTGGSNNVHEILCFKAAPVGSSGSSGSVNVYQNPTLHPDQQFFLANYYPSDWTGQLTAIGIYFDTNLQSLAANATPTWDARCVLTGVASTLNPCSTGATSVTAENWNNTAGTNAGGRVMLTWDPVSQKGEAFEWSGGITAAQQTTLGTQTRLSYLRGDRSNEINSSGVGLYRARDAVLSDIVDSSPNWIGPPQNPYTLTSQWVDEVWPSMTAPENATGAQTYAQYMAQGTVPSPTSGPNGELQRPNIVFAGANDGFLHGFRAGSLDANGDLLTSPTPNDGYEVLAYMPGAVLNSIHSSNTQLDFSNSQYSHAWYVDAPPASGDVFYGNQWHTWVVGGLGAGGAAIYALNVTDPTQFSESNATNIVVGEWSPSNLTCTQQTVTACGVNLGQTYGTPQIRRFHTGQWGFVFGNGYNAANGASGIYIALLNTTTGAPTFYWLPTNLTFSTTVPNGIATVEAADYDLDHTVDYIYAGDLQGNLWKFDVTSNVATNWGVTTSSPLFTTIGGEPITTQVQVSTVKTITTVQNAVGLDVSNAPQRVIINFGTGQQIPQSLTTQATYETGTQYLYGVWDWDMTEWNALSTFQPGIGLTAPQTITAGTSGNMQAQTLTETLSTGSNSTGTATLSTNPVCWSGSSTCNGANNQMGWYTALPGTNEQIIFDPFISKIDGSLNFNTYIPASSNLLSCQNVTSLGFSLGMDSSTGGALTTPLFNVGGQNFSGVQTNAIGTGTMLNSGTAGGGKNYLITHSSCSGSNCQGLQFTQTNNYTVTTGQRIYWIQKR